MTILDQYFVWGSGFAETSRTLTLCDIIFMHYVLYIIYQLYGEDNTSKFTF